MEFLRGSGGGYYFFFSQWQTDAWATPGGDREKERIPHWNPQPFCPFLRGRTGQTLSESGSDTNSNGGGLKIILREVARCHVKKKTTMTASLRRREGEGVVGSFDIPYGKFLRDKSLVPCGKRRVVGRPGVYCMSLFIRNVKGGGWREIKKHAWASMFPRTAL